MSRVRANILANLTGRFWVTAIGIFVPPLYVKHLGVESYGLVGIFSTISSIFLVLDLGLTTTLQRETAQSSVSHGHQASEAGATAARIQTFALAYTLIGLVVGGILYASAPWIAHHWLQTAVSHPGDVIACLRIMAAVIALLWPNAMFTAALNGLQRQVAVNVISMVAATFKSVGALLVLIFVSRSILAFFVWQLIAAALHLTMSASASRYALTSHPKPSRRFRLDLLLSSWKFSASIWGVSITTVLLTQLDKLVISKRLTLASLGYYTLAYAVGSAPGNVVAPIFTALFPRICEVSKRADSAETARLYHAGSQLMSVVVLPVCAVAALFSRDLVLLWTGQPQLVQAIAPTVSILLAGTAFNAMANIPYALLLAHGWSSINLWVNSVAVLCIAPLMYVLCGRYGIEGVAFCWCLLNASYVVVLVPWMHRHVLPAEKRAWYLRDVGLPALGAIAPACLVLLLRPGTHTRLGSFLVLAAVTPLSFAGALAASPLVRQKILESLGRVGLRAGSVKDHPATELREGEPSAEDAK